MAIAKLRPTAGEPVSNTPVTPEAPQKSIFTELVPSSKIDSLLKYVEGYPWTVNYRAQILNTNNTVAFISRFYGCNKNLIYVYQQELA